MSFEFPLGSISGASMEQINRRQFCPCISENNVEHVIWKEIAKSDDTKKRQTSKEIKNVDVGDGDSNAFHSKFVDESGGVSISSERAYIPQYQAFCFPVDMYGFPVFQGPYSHYQEAELWNLVAFLRPTTEEMKQQSVLFGCLKEITENVFPGSDLLRFGSTVNGFSLRNADIDFCLFVEEKLVKDEANANEMEVREYILTILGNELVRQNRFSQTKILSRARVPIIKLKDSLTGISCDIGVNNRLALYNTELLKLYGQIDRRVIPLALLVKWWAKKRSMNDSYWGTLSSYCLLLMLIFYLQQGSFPLLPVLTRRDVGIDDLCEKIGSMEIGKGNQPCRDLVIDGIQVYYQVDISKYVSKDDSYRSSLFPLLFGFFKFYAQVFSYSQSVVCPRLGIEISKEEKGWTIQVWNFYNRRAIRVRIHFGFVWKIRLMHPET